MGWSHCAECDGIGFRIIYRLRTITGQFPHAYTQWDNLTRDEATIVKNKLGANQDIFEGALPCVCRAQSQAD